MRDLTRISIRVAVCLLAVAAGVASAQETHRPEANPAGRKHFVGIIGQVLRPGVYEMAGPTIDALSLVERAGGLTTNSTGGLRVIRDGQSGNRALLSDGLSYELHPGDLLVIESRQLPSINAEGPALAPRREDIQVGLIQLNERPVVLRLRSEYGTLRSLLKLLGQSLKVVSATRIIDPDGDVLAGTAVSSSTRLKSETVLVFDPESIDATRIPDLPPPIPLVASRPVAPVLPAPARAHGGAIADASQAPNSVTGSRPVSHMQTISPGESEGDSVRMHAMRLGNDLSQSPPPVGLDHEAPVPPPIDLGERPGQDAKSRGNDHAAHLADVAEWEEPGSSDKPPSAFAAIWAFLLPILALAFFGVSWLRARRRRQRRREEFLEATDGHDHENGDVSQTEQHVEPADAADQSETPAENEAPFREETAAQAGEEDADEPAPADVSMEDYWPSVGIVVHDRQESSAPRTEIAPIPTVGALRVEVLQSLIQDALPVIEQPIRALEGITFYGRPSELPAFRLDGPQEIKGPNVGRRKGTEDEPAASRVRPGVRPIMRHDVVEPETAGHPVPKPHFDAADLKPRIHKGRDLSARQIAEEASSILDHALSSVGKGVGR